MGRYVLPALCALILLAGCAGTGSLPAGETPRPAATAPAPAAPPATTGQAPTASAAPFPVATAAPDATAPPRIALEPVAGEFRSPTQVTNAGDGSGRLFVVEQRGVIKIMRDGQVLPRPFLDIEAIVGSSGNEQGLLSVAFHPRYGDNGRFFVNYTDQDGDTVVAGYRVSADPDQADPRSATLILTIDQPAANHNGGLLTFGPDGYLYIGTGDGGAAGDPWGNAQNRATLLGKLLRIDVDGGTPYAVPADNPFVGQDDVRPEIWAWGLRNPWRFSFDRASGDLYIADVGQNAYEEVHYQPATSRGGENYGWNIIEAASCFRGGDDCDRGGLELPVAYYSHRDGGCSITGGYVYRGSAFPQLTGIYFYGDYCSGLIWALRSTGGAWQSDMVLRSDVRISSFGEDEAGEIYLTDRDSGRLLRLVGL